MRLTSTSLTGLVLAVLVGCSNMSAPSPTLADLEVGNIDVYRAQDRQDSDVYLVAYTVEAPPDLAWQSTLGMPHWLQNTPFTNEVVEIPSPAEPDGTEHFLVRWQDGSAQEMVLKRDIVKRHIELAFTSDSASRGSPARCSIRMRPFLEHSTLVQVEIRLNSSFSARLVALLSGPVGVVGGLHRDHQLRASWAEFAEKHRQATARLLNQRPAFSGRTHVISIGVNASEKSEHWPRLRYAEADAEAFYRWARYAYPASTAQEPVIREILTGTNAQTGRIGKLLSRLSKREEVHDGDTIIIFFAGHMDLEEDALSPHDRLQTYLVTADAETTNLGFTAVNRKKVLEAARFSQAGQVLLLFDSCYSGGERVTGPENLTAMRTRGRRIPDVADSSPGHRLAVLAAAGPFSQAAESDAHGHGLFTFLLLQGMRGEADLDRDGIVTLDELSTFISSGIGTMSNGQQVPYKEYPPRLGTEFRWRPQD